MNCKLTKMSTKNLSKIDIEIKYLKKLEKLTLKILQNLDNLEFHSLSSLGLPSCPFCPQPIVCCGCPDKASCDKFKGLRDSALRTVQELIEFMDSEVAIRERR
ncbi:MAG TPA: hypothetical protein VI728_03285 [Syntrophales bacterium]|nr:hypothetical protein [Syntrophales bacterium]